VNTSQGSPTTQETLQDALLAGEEGRQMDCDLQVEVKNTGNSKYERK
jgi:hypothetical protein